MLLDQIAFGVPLLVTRITWILTFLKSQRKKGIPPPLLYSTGTVTFRECPPRLIKGIRTYPLFSVYEVSRTLFTIQSTFETPWPGLSSTYKTFDSILCLFKTTWVLLLMGFSFDSELCFPSCLLCS